MCCKRFEFYTRHESVVQRLTHFVRSAGLRVDNEVSITGWERPADLFVERWSQGESLALDVTITYPLAPGLGLCRQSARKALAQKERRKAQKYAHLLEGHAPSFSTFALSTFGDASGQARDFLEDLVHFYASHQHLPKAECHSQLLQQVQVGLMQEVGKRLLASVAAVDDHPPAEFRGWTPMVTV